MSGEQYLEQLLKDRKFKKRLQTANELLERFAGFLHDAQPQIEKYRHNWQRTFGEPYPQDIEDWIRWAVRIDYPMEQLASGEGITPAQLEPIIEGYLLRLKDSRPRNRQSDPAVAKRRNKVADMLERGMTQGQISAALGESIDTIKNDRKFLKLG